MTSGAPKPLAKAFEPIHEHIIVRNRVRLWAAKNVYTLLFLVVFGWLFALTEVVIHYGT